MLLYIDILDIVRTWNRKIIENICMYEFFLLSFIQLFQYNCLYINFNSTSVLLTMQTAVLTRGIVSIRLFFHHIPVFRPDNMIVRFSASAF